MLHRPAQTSLEAARVSRRGTLRSALALVALAASASGCVLVPSGHSRGGYGGHGGHGGYGGYGGQQAPGGYGAPGPGTPDGPVQAAPPPLQAEVMTVAPAPGWFWITGFWTWHSGRHLWVGGRWEAPRRGYNWVPHRWESHGRGWREAPGRWDRGR